MSSTLSSDILTDTQVQPPAASVRHNIHRIQGHNIEMLVPENKMLLRLDELVGVNTSASLKVVAIQWMFSAYMMLDLILNDSRPIQ